MTRKEVPVADWVTIPDLYRDPFPIYERLRAEGGVHWVPAVNRYLVTSYEAVHATELDQEIFSANEQGSLQIRAMGHSMLRRDDPEHYVERKAWQPALRPGMVKRVWTEVFRETASHLLDDFIAKGPGADLVWDFAAPYAAECLRQVCGLYNADQADLQRWSQTMIDATGNYADDPEVWRLGEQSFNEVDASLDEMLAWHSEHPDHSLISQLLQIPDYEMPLERIRANLKMTIGGGLNEPRDAIGVAALAMLQNPEQLAMVQADPSLWHTVFDETIRWVAPIGMYSRQATRETELAGFTLPAGARLGICILSANRDASVWEDAADFNIRREPKPHLAFGKGVHVCLGAWVARAEVADIALPMLFERLEGLRLIEDEPAEMGGWVFRGMTKMPVTWDRALPAQEVTGGSADRSATTPGRAVSNVDATPAPRVAIVGSGPSGCFTAQAVRRAFPAAPIDVIDRLPTPYGLVRYGVAADHQGTKAVARQFDRLFTSEDVTYRGNLHLGSTLTLEEIRAAYDVVVLATGMHGDAVLDIPGSQVARGSGSVTRLLNGHPDEDESQPLGTDVVVIGQGNVAMDIARLLTRDAAGFAGSDIDDATHQAFAGAVRTIHLVGRSLPGAAKFDPVMVRELAGLPGIEHILHGAGELADDGRDARIDAVRSLLEAHRAPGAPIRARMHWWFGLTPREIEVDATGTSEAAGSAASAVVFTDATGEPVRIPATDVITAVGFTANVDSPVPAAAHVDGRVEPGLYVAGWLRRGPRGTIPDQRTDAKGLAQLIVDDIRSGAVSARAAGLTLRSCETDFTGWQRIELHERSAAAPGRERAKLRTHAQLLATAADTSIAVPVAQHGAALTAGVPVTVLFGTESGGAELVAEELHRMFGSAGDVDVRDLAEVAPAELGTDRFYLIVCSTYGDGEVPTSVQPFHAALTGAGGAGVASGAGDSSSAAPSLAGVRYAMFGMGDRSYDKTYSRGSELVDEALTACGATRIGEYGRHDAGGPVPASEAALDWAAGVLTEAAASLAGAR
ncbi:cytochrome P450 [Leucobacter sp. cx-42]|uniref:cytochrome P450 n=1 Tax=unclassified Leucobacter TaxID=2621730 RepID=UPI00165DCD33|nr:MULTISPECIES: cytochrome P450 [unclassified Leucobacter]MBC9954462.1 cytochrome P450 [Leucobacter sp. cx-42]